MSQALSSPPVSAGLDPSARSESDRMSTAAAQVPSRQAGMLPVVASRGSLATFEELFGTAPLPVLQAMDAADDDVATQVPAIGGRIDGVALTRRQVPILLRSPFAGRETVSATATVKVSCGVPADRRGLHVSRIGHVVAQSLDDIHDDVAAYALRLARAAAASQYGCARVDVDASIPYLEETGTIGRRRPKWSLEHLRIVGRAQVTPTRTIVDTGLRVEHLVACPCVQQTYKHALRATAGEAPATPLLTHSQRCRTTVIVRNLREPFVAADALAALDAVLVRTCNTLPRDRELACVYRAHRSPQFVEDALRGAVLQISRLWPSAAFDRIEGRSRSVESIHEYDLVAVMTFTPSSQGGVR